MKDLESDGKIWEIRSANIGKSEENEENHGKGESDGEIILCI
jgi:hypothetical protein